MRTIATKTKYMVMGIEILCKLYSFQLNMIFFVLVVWLSETSSGLQVEELHN